MSLLISHPYISCSVHDCFLYIFFCHFLFFCNKKRALSALIILLILVLKVGRIKNIFHIKEMRAEGQLLQLSSISEPLVMRYTFMEHSRSYFLDMKDTGERTHQKPRSHSYTDRARCMVLCSQGYQKKCLSSSTQLKCPFPNLSFVYLCWKQFFWAPRHYVLDL